MYVKGCLGQELSPEVVPNLRSEGNDEKLQTEECGNLPLHEGQVVELEVTKDCGSHQTFFSII